MKDQNQSDKPYLIYSKAKFLILILRPRMHPIYLAHIFAILKCLNWSKSEYIAPHKHLPTGICAFWTPKFRSRPWYLNGKFIRKTLNFIYLYRSPKSPRKPNNAIINKNLQKSAPIKFLAFKRSLFFTFFAPVFLVIWLLILVFKQNWAFYHSQIYPR